MIIKGYDGGPVGLETLAAAIGEESVTIEDVCEPYLMQLGFLSKTPGDVWRHSLLTIIWDFSRTDKRTFDLMRNA